ncbi:cobalt ABC transporter, ATP-binding protein [Citrifermentans bemidjiense Bem]|uniref:ABC transporter ATP-binding protein n=1 Tax=Citrifermentans bemidjiense (strain ATCC BAA-1014 / DSM 16622 / JCM 12645 / Bem) TaxID=404380 RepID=B5EEL1_CITBB|nr:ATP-binding cassette domain-containing protein [Citrifermentans bemidjiense]ACH40797.1 cobalt ABC transporter, ATP-binding protein [Citrifermentans bemidjiense Bem]
MDTRISVDLQSYKYPDGTVALSDIRLAVKRGEFTGILGSNGSGKTTLLKVMDGLIKGYQGEVLLDGDNVLRLHPRDIYRKVGLVFQNPDDQLFASNVFEDTAFGPRNMGCAEAEVRRRVEQALSSVDMAEFGAKGIHNLSYGQKKRVCIAGLLAMGHEILLMDEPTAGLDPMGEYRMMELLTRLNKEQGVTIVMATHSVDLVPIFLHQLHILSRGKLVRGGTPEEVFTAPDELANVKLRLPHIAELIYKLKHDEGLPFARIPLTIGEARREIVEAMGK